MRFASVCIWHWRPHLCYLTRCCLCLDHHPWYRHVSWLDTHRWGDVIFWIHKLFSKFIVEPGGVRLGWDREGTVIDAWRRVDDSQSPFPRAADQGVVLSDGGFTSVDWGAQSDLQLVTHDIHRCETRKWSICLEERLAGSSQERNLFSLQSMSKPSSNMTFHIFCSHFGLRLQQFRK